MCIFNKEHLQLLHRQGEDKSMSHIFKEEPTDLLFVQTCYYGVAIPLTHTS